MLWTLVLLPVVGEMLRPLLLQQDAPSAKEHSGPQFARPILFEHVLLPSRNPHGVGLS